MLKVLIGLPSYSRTVYGRTMMSLFADKDDKMDIMLAEGLPYLWRVRNGIARSFLSTDYDVLLFVDHDVSWRPGAIRKLVESGKPVAMGAYPKRKPGPPEFSVRLLQEPGFDNEWMTIEGGPMGFCAIHREALETLEYPYFYEDEATSEDFWFCRKWREAGGDVWLDTSMIIGHHDGSHVHVGRVLEWAVRLQGGASEKAS